MSAPAATAREVLVHREGAVLVVTINRPQARNAIDRATSEAIARAMDELDGDPGLTLGILTGAGEHFCAGMDLKAFLRGERVELEGRGLAGIAQTPPRKPLIAAVEGYALAGGCELALVCDLVVAADNARFGQTGPKVGSFDGGYGSGLLARQIGQKRAREVWFQCRQYGAEQAYDWGLVNEVVPLEDLELETVAWAKEMLAESPLALRMLKAAHNAADDGLAGIQQLAGDATLLFYMTEEAQEGRDAYKEKRRPEFEKFPKRP